MDSFTMPDTSGQKALTKTESLEVRVSDLEEKVKHLSMALSFLVKQRGENNGQPTPQN